MFLSIRADAGGDRSPYGSFWFDPIPFRGGNVTNDAALGLPAVTACVRVIAETIAALPFVLYEEQDDGGKKAIKNHWLYKLFKRPNPFQNGMEYREMMSGHLALRGNAYSQIVANGAGEVEALMPLHPDRVRIEMTSDTKWRYVVRNLDNTEQRIPRGSVFHIKGLSPDGIVGYNPITLLRNAVAAGLAAQDYGLRFFQNDAKPGGWIEYPGQFATTEDRNLFREQWQSQQTGEHRGKTTVLEFGMKYHEVGMANDDAQFVESRKFTRAEIASIYRVPLHLIQDLDKSSFSNIEQQSLDFVIHCVTPWLVRWEEAIEWHFLDPEIDTDLDVEFPTKSLLRGDAVARSTFYHNAILDGWMTRNEVRVLENMNPLDGLDEPLRPLNMVEEGDAEDAEGEPGQEPPPAPAPQQLPAPPPAKQGSARLEALARASAERIARKEVAMLRNRADDEVPALYAKHARFVAETLCVDDGAAERYCMAQMEFIAAARPSERQLIDVATKRLRALALAEEVTQ